MLALFLNTQAQPKSEISIPKQEDEPPPPHPVFYMEVTPRELDVHCITK